MNKRFLVLGVIASAFVVLFSFMLVRFQIISRNQYTEKVDDLVSKKNELTPLRGSIYDRNEDVPLAENISRYSIYLSPSDLPSKDRDIELKRIADFLSVGVDNVQSALKGNKTIKQRTLRKGLTYEELSDYVEMIATYPGLKWKQDLQRYYPFEKSMSHILGYVGDVSTSELRELRYENYSNFEIIGKAGVEKQYEKELRGIKGIAKENINVFGQSVSDTAKVIQPPRPGRDIVLTIDRNIQALMEKALGPRMGAGIIMKPATGEILAMVSYPRFDPNILVSSTDRKLLTSMQNNPGAPFLNRTIQSTAPPASTMKAIMSTAFLQEFPHQWDYTVNCLGYIVIGNRRFYDWLHSGHGYHRIEGALAVSCNIFFYTIGLKKLGPELISRYASMFGLGSLTGIDLPFEAAGTVPSPDWKEARFGQPWVPGDTANFSIGQGFLATTPLQMAQATAAIVNDGVVYKPHVLKAVKDSITGEVIREVQPEIERTMSVDSKVFKKVRRAMRGVITQGTAKVVITTKAVKIAAKTGTGQATGTKDSWHSWFISYAPYDAAPKNKIVLVLWVDAINTWEWWAPKAANIIYESLFNHKTYEETVADFKKQNLWYL